MTRYDPSILVTRMRIERDERSVFDEKFHAGINILRGENSSGKSTALNFLFYGLGGDLNDWSQVALLCNRVFVEVLLNGKVATFSREVTENKHQPMDIFGGSLDAALVAPRAEWVRYPYKREESRDSFSQAIFRLLHMPQASTENSNITMHQILRLLYADQLSPVDSIFKFERFDPPTVRDAVGRLLCGAYDAKMYENDLAIRRFEAEFDAVSGELRSYLSVLSQSGQSMTLDWVNAERVVLNERRAALLNEIAAAEKLFFSAKGQDEVTLQAQEKVYQRVQLLQTEIAKQRELLDGLAFTVTDSDAFIAALECKLKALNDANLASDFIGTIQFQQCPSCFAELKAEVTGECNLCRNVFDRERTTSRITALINDTAIQLRQSQQLQEDRRKNYVTQTNNINMLTEEWRKAARDYEELRKLPSSEIQEKLRDLQRQTGYLEREAENLEQKASIAQLVDKLSKQKAFINGEITRLKTENTGLARAQQSRLEHAYTAIADEIKRLLRLDLRRQDSFEDPKSIEFNFAKDSITVDGQNYFSASSRVILKSSFFAGFLAAATKDVSFRHPRFCIIDTIEDKGMEITRSHNFQLQ